MSAAKSNSTGGEGVPAGYREVLDWRMGDRPWQVIVINVLALFSLVPWLFVFGWFGLTVAGMPQSGEIGWPQLVLAVGGGLLTLVLHELGHGLAMRAFGAHPRFGVLWTRLMVYATAPGHGFSRSAYMVVGLAPLAGLSLLAMFGMVLLSGSPWVALLVLCAAANGAGSCGDLWVLSAILRYPPSANFVDERDGMRILLPS